MSEQDQGRLGTVAPPIFEVGQKVLVDEGLRGPHTIKSIEEGMIPAVGEDLEDTEEPGYWYVVEPDSGEEPRKVPEYNLMLAKDVLPEAMSAPQAPEGDDSQGSAPPSIEERLRAAYKEGQGERTKVLPIAPGRFNDLAARFSPIDWDLRRKLIRKAERRGESGPEVDLRINSALMADACQSMLVRPESGADYVELHTQVERFRGGGPICFDSRLADILGMELSGGESEGQICRLLFNDPGAFESHYLMLNGWSIQAFADEDDEDAEEDEGGDRPT